MKTIFVNGTFDLLHRGHLELLNYAKSLGDYLCGGIDTDERVKEKKLEILRTHGEDSFKMTMIWNFDESVVSMLPDGKVPYQPVESDVQANREKGLPQRSTIRNSARQFYRFVKGGDDQLNKIKRESIFINILETLPPPEAEILVLVKDKALNTKYNITKELVAEAYPEITWGNRS